MRQVAQTELADIFFREIGGYLPKIELGISTLHHSCQDSETLGEVYRYFHNIKGAASQVSYTGLSQSAGICEMLLGGLLENRKTPEKPQLEFLTQVQLNIAEFCELPEKTPAAEESLLANTLSFFKSLMHQLGPDNPISVSPDMLKLFPDLDYTSGTTQAPAPLTDTNESGQAPVSHLDCLLSLRSVIPLLKELADQSPENDTFHTVALPPMIRAVQTLASVTDSAGLKGHHSLLSQFLVLLIKLEQSPELSNNATLELLQEFLAYLDLIFSLPPKEGEEAVAKIQGNLDTLCDLLIHQQAQADSEGQIHEKALSLNSLQISEEPIAEGVSVSYPNNQVEPIAELTEAVDFPEGVGVITPSMDDELLLIFQSECEEHLLIIDQTVTLLRIKLSDGDGDYESSREQLMVMRRAAHTLKGAAAMTGFDAISQCAYCLEEFLGWLHDECTMLEPTDLDLLVDGADTIKLLMADDSRALPVNLEDLEARFHNAMNRPRSAITTANNWKLEHPTDAAAIFKQPHQEFADQHTASCDFLTDIDEDDILLNITSDTGHLDPSAISPDEGPTAFNTDQETVATPGSQQIDPELLAIFQSECDEHLQAIASALNTLVTSITLPTPVSQEIRDSLGAIRRSIHTLKGAAAMTGYDQLASCSHSLEDLLDWLHDSALHIEPQDLSVVAEAMDTIESISLFDIVLSTSDTDELIESVREHLRRRSTTETAAKEEAKRAAPLESTVQSAIIHHTITEQPDSSAIPGDTGNIRVKLADLDELINIEGELVVVRGSVEKLLDKFSQSLANLNIVKDTLRRKSQELEVGFEAQSLYGFGSGNAAQDSDFTGTSAELSDFDPIELDRYSQLNLIIRSLNEIAIDVNAIHAEFSALGTSLQGQVARQQLAMEVIQEKLMRIRMTPLSSISRVLHRTVRQTAAKLGKNVQLAITGDDVYMDRFIWSRTIDPFSHILRNCIDHGIENEETRRKLGKPDTGQITFHASQRGRFVVLKISDDGQGIHTELLRQKLMDEKQISANEQLSDTDLLPYIFQPSVTTRDDVSQTSGRGVGLDVVLKNIQDLRGTIQVHNLPGKGVTFELRIPITLSVNRAIIFGLAEKSFAVPIHDIVEVRKFAAAEIINGEKVQWNEHTLPLIDLANSLQLSSPYSETEPALTLIIENAENTYHAVRIGAIEEQREIIVKDLGSHLRHVRGINGVTLTGEGAIIPILNLHELATQSETHLARRHQKEQTDSAEPLQVLVVDDSISVRYTLTRLLESRSWSSHQAVDGVDALEKLESLVPDVIVLDIEMPRMNGFEFTSIIRHDDRYKDIPVVMLTSRASDKHQNKALELGVDHYMIKPFQEDDFLQLIGSMETNRS